MYTDFHFFQKNDSKNCKALIIDRFGHHKNNVTKASFAVN